MVNSLFSLFRTQFKWYFSPNHPIYIKVLLVILYPIVQFRCFIVLPFSDIRLFPMLQATFSHQNEALTTSFIASLSLTEQ